MFEPALQAPFGTYTLSPVDLAIVALLALTVVPVLETAKWMERRGWLGKTD